VFPQFEQLQPSQLTRAAKHSQYSFKHREFLQLQCFLFFGVAFFTSAAGFFGVKANGHGLGTGVAIAAGFCCGGGATAGAINSLAAGGTTGLS